MINVNKNLSPLRLLREFRLNYRWSLISREHLEFCRISEGEEKILDEMFRFQFSDENSVEYSFGRRFFMVDDVLDHDTNHFLVIISIARDTLNLNGRLISFTLCSPLNQSSDKFSFLATVTYVFHKKLGNMKWVDLHHISSSKSDIFQDEFSGNEVRFNSRFGDLMDSIHEWVAEFSFIESSSLELA